MGTVNHETDEEEFFLQHLTFGVDSLTEAQNLKNILWDSYEVRGEVEIIPQEHDKYRVNVISEKDLTPSQLEKLPGKQG